VQAVLPHWDSIIDKEFEKDDIPCGIDEIGRHRHRKVARQDHRHSGLVEERTCFGPALHV